MPTTLYPPHIMYCLYPPRSQYNPIWEFGYSIPGTGPCDMTFTSVTGHLMSLDFPSQVWEKVWDTREAELQQILSGRY